MKSFEELQLMENEKQALMELKDRLLVKFPDVEIVLFGSKTRGDFNKESDIDLLIIIDAVVNSKLEEEVTEITYDIELKFDVVFGKIIENRNFWKSPLANAMPIHFNIDRDGVPV